MGSRWRSHAGSHFGARRLRDWQGDFNTLRIETLVEPRERISRDSNQFGLGQEIAIGGPVRLLVPTRKLPHDPPREPDHFACYKILEGKSIDRRVQLRDQLGSYRTVVRQPALHCNPASKLHPPADPTKIYDKYAHLACYAIDRRRLDPPANRKTVNQFERARIRAEVAKMLCVPSLQVLS